MKNITPSADEDLIKAARQRAVAEHTTLNEQFRLWLQAYTRRRQNIDEAVTINRTTVDNQSDPARVILSPYRKCPIQN